MQVTEVRNLRIQMMSQKSKRNTVDVSCFLASPREPWRVAGRDTALTSLMSSTDTFGLRGIDSRKLLSGFDGTSSLGRFFFFAMTEDLNSST